MFLFYLSGGNFGVELGDDGGMLEDGFEEKLSEAVEGLSQKSLQGRVSCLEALCTGLSRRFIPEFVMDR